MQRNATRMGALAALGAALLVTLVVPALAGSASAAPVPMGSGGSAAQQWAYGGQDWVNVTAHLGNATYDEHAFFGWQVIFTATNTSATTVELEAQRTMAASLYAQYCQPNCSSPNVFGNLSVTGWEKDVGFANFTTQSSVTEMGSAVPAVGIVNASATTSGNLSESLRLSVTGPMGSHSASGSLSVAGHAAASVAFSPSLGLVPFNVSKGDTWNSSAPFAAHGSWALAYAYQRSGFLGGNISGSGSPSGSVNASGNVSLNGEDLGNMTLRNGLTVPVIALEIQGPFDDVDGVILVPHDSEIFSAGLHDWAHGEFGSELVSTARLDVAVDAFHHVRVVAAASQYSGSDSSLSGSGGATAGMASPAASAPAGGLVQAQPESVAQAQRASSCLVGGCGAGSAVGSGLLGLLVIGLIVAAVLGTVAVIEYRRWARRPGRGGLVGGYSQVVPGTSVPPAPPAVPPAPPQRP